MTFSLRTSDPDDPHVGIMSPAEAMAAAMLVAVLNPELIDHSMDGPIFR